MDKSINEILLRGFKLQEARDFAAAEQCYRQVLLAHPIHGNALHLMGRLKFEMREIGQAIEFMRRSITSEPSNAVFYNNLALVFVAVRNLEGARICFTQAVQLKPDYVEAHHNLGNVWSDLGRPAEAAVCYREATRINAELEEARRKVEAAAPTEKKEPETEDSLADHLARAMARWQISM